MLNDINYSTSMAPLVGPLTNSMKNYSNKYEHNLNIRQILNKVLITGNWLRVQIVLEFSGKKGSVLLRCLWQSNRFNPEEKPIVVYYINCYELIEDILEHDVN